MKLASAALLSLCCAAAAPGAQEPPGRAKVQACAACHGASGLSTMPDAPHLAGQPRIYLVQQMKAFRSGKRAHEVMNVVAKPLSDGDIEELAEWYSSVIVEVREKR